MSTPAMNTAVTTWTPSGASGPVTYGQTIQGQQAAARSANFSNNMMFAATAISAVGDIFTGNAAEDQAEYNARIYEQQAGFTDELLAIEIDKIDFARDIDISRIRRAKSKQASTLISNVAYAGLEFSGSPVSVLIDNLTQAGIDEEITKYNYEIEKAETTYNRQQQKIGYMSKASNIRYGGAIQKSSSYSNALSKVLKGGYKYSARRWGLPSTQGRGGGGEG